MLIERSMHPGYLSNAYLVADEEGGAAVFVDSGAPIDPLLAAAERWRLTPVAVLRTTTTSSTRASSGFRS